MKHRKVTNVAASVRQRLLNEARATGRPFNELLQYFAMERFLYRLSKSPHGEQFVLKGALMLAMWEVSLTRPTKDIDLLGHVANDIDQIVAVVQEVCGQEVEARRSGLRQEQRPGGADCRGGRARGCPRSLPRKARHRQRSPCSSTWASATSWCRRPVTTDYPTILDLPAPRIRGYTRESVIAEKFHTMVRRGLLNSRMRDFFDIWVLVATVRLRRRGPCGGESARHSRGGTSRSSAPPCGADGGVRGGHRKGHAVAGVSAKEPAGGCVRRAGRGGRGDRCLPRSGWRGAS